MKKTNNKTIVLDKLKPIYMGMDVHKKSWKITILHQDVVIDRVTMRPDKLELKKYLSRYAGHCIESVYEAGFCGFYLHDDLTSLGVKNIVVAPNKIPGEQGNRVKTDKRDSYKLAFYHSKGLLRGIYTPSKEEVSSRHFLRLRSQFVKRRAATINQIKSLLHLYGIYLECVGLPVSVAKDLLERNDLPLEAKESLRALLGLLNYLRAEVKSIEKRAISVIKDHRNYRIMISIPGVGPLLAAKLQQEISDWSRFDNEKQLSSYLGLTPSEYSSGEKVSRGRITGQGNRFLRAGLIEASWILIRKDPVMKAVYERIKAQTGNGNKAIVAIARKLICRMRAMIHKQEAYIPGLAA